MKARRVLVVLLSAWLLLCLCAAGAVALVSRSAAWLLLHSLDDEPDALASTGSAIARYELPPGFAGGYAASAAGFSLVAYNGDDGLSHIYLLQGPHWLNLDEEALERQMRSASGEAWRDLTVVERYPCQIRDEQVTVVVSEGRNHDNVRYRSASALFSGHGGPALLNISMPAAGWDQELVDDFLDSLQ